MSDVENKEAPKDPTENNTSSKEASESSDMEKMQKQFNEHLQPLKDEIAQLKEELHKKDDELKKKDNDISNYRKNMFTNMVADKPTETPLTKFVDEYYNQINAGLEAAWRNSGYDKRPELKAKWLEAAQNEIIRCIRG